MLFALMAFNEFGRSTKWGGIILFFIVPIVLTIFVWPTTAAPGNEYGTGTWFNWVKTYSALAGCLWFMALRYIPSLTKKKWALFLLALILGLNILEAAIRDFQCFSFGAWNGAYVDNLWVMSGPWNIMNGIADHSFYCGLTLLLSCTIPAFFIKKGAWLQHRAQTLALWIMFVMTVPQFADRIAPVPTTHNAKAFFVLSLLSLIANVSLAAYQFNIIRKKKLNPLKDEIFVETNAYKQVIKENR